MNPTYKVKVDSPGLNLLDDFVVQKVVKALGWPEESFRFQSGSDGELYLEVSSETPEKTVRELLTQAEDTVCRLSIRQILELI